MNHGVINDSNETNIDNFFIQLYDITSIIALPLAIIGLISNIFVLYIFITDRNFHKPTYYLIMISVTSDIITAISMTYGYSHILARTTDDNGADIMCQSAVYITATSYTISIMNLCLIAFDRYCNIVKAVSQFNRLYKNNFLLFVEISIWITAVIINAPLILVMESKNKDYGLCDFIPITNIISAYLIFLVIMLYIIPSTFIVTVYVKIIIFRKNYVSPATNNAEQIEEDAQKKRFIKALMSIAISYVCFTWPYFATILGYAITKKTYYQLRFTDKVAYVTSLLSRSLTTSITIISPFTYLLFDSNIRKRAVKVCKQLLGLESNRQRRLHHIRVMSSAR
ncbi:5-hydroxytryptamine receptor 1D [Trichoplax sp. H2]|nr:5-hydroxytryptamine receptor 1D [Trichoplax sp. H2]|eukprot:RDD39715.1 5-hydroxytryptamine receptor 1D [Trichoplax sp. H2]